MVVDALRDKVSAVEAQMTAGLDEVRATFEHAGDKGTAVEDSFRAFLRKFLPRRLEVGHGEVIDREGTRSRQTDILVASEDHPLTFTPDLPGLFFVDAVVAAGEVKSTLTSTDLETALESSRDFKRLEMQFGKADMRFTNPSDEARFYRCPPCFLVAFASQLTLARIRDKILEFVKTRSVEPNRLVDAVFVLGDGWVINFGDGKGGFQGHTKDGGLAQGWVVQKSESVLFDFLCWLSVVMPKIIRFEPVLTGYLLRYVGEGPS